MDAVIMASLPPLGRRNTSSRVPWLQRHYPPSLLLRTRPSPSRLRPLSRGHRLYGLPCSAAFAVGRGGLLQLLDMSLSSCRRYHPAGVARRVSQVATPHAAFCPTEAGSALRSFRLSRPPVRSLSVRPNDSLPIHGWVCRRAPRFRFPSALPSSYEAPGFYLGGTVPH